MKKLLAVLLVIILAPALIPSADATLIVFQGNDPDAGPTDPRPNSDAARASFDAAAAAFGFTFARPIEAFGTYFTGIGTFPAAEVFVEFNDGSFHSFELERHSTGGVQFFGFMGLAHPISAVVIVERFGVDDVFGIDDVRFVATVSEPPAWLLIGFGLLGLGLISRVVFQSDVALH